jgi:hypothetical protein
MNDDELIAEWKVDLHNIIDEDMILCAQDLVRYELTGKLFEGKVKELKDKIAQHYPDGAALIAVLLFKDEIVNRYAKLNGR